MARTARRFTAAAGLLFVTSVSVAQLGVIRAQQPPPPPPRQIPGITADDQFPRGCVDCHLNYTEMKLDVRISTLMAQWTERVEPGLLAKAQASAPAGTTLKGRHPVVTDALGDIPARCLRCHGADATDAPAFRGMLHATHLSGGQENPFLTLFQGECTHCHKLDKATGTWSIPSGAER
jgi:cytochrome c553